MWGSAGRVDWGKASDPGPGAGPQGGWRRNRLRQWGQDKAVRGRGTPEGREKRWGHVRPMLSHEEGLGDLGRVSAEDSRRQDYGGEGHKEGQGGSKAGRGLGMGRVSAYFLRWRDWVSQRCLFTGKAPRPS